MALFRSYFIHLNRFKVMTCAVLRDDKVIHGPARVRFW